MLEDQDILLSDISIIEETDNTETIETVQIVEVNDIELFTIETDDAFSALGAPNAQLQHSLLNSRDLSDQHPITAITGLREELNEIERLKTVYSDKINMANYYKWHDASYDTYGYFVSLVPNTTSIKICDGSDILGVSINDAGFIGGQDADIPRDTSYGLIATSGLVDVCCELDVKVGDYVVSNSYGYATKSDSDYGYKVLAKETKNGVEYAVIMLGVQADLINTLGEEFVGLEKRVNTNEINIVSAVNTANQAYNKANDTDASNKVMSDKVDSALGVVDKITSDVENLESQVSNSTLISTQAKAIAESAATSAESMRNETVEKVNEALADTTKLRKEFEAKVVEIDAELDSAALELQATNEDLTKTKDELSKTITATQKEIDSLEKDLEPLATWPNGSGVDRATAFAGFVARADEDSATLASVTKFEGDFGDSMTTFIQEATKENATVKAIASYQQKDKDGNPYGPSGASALIGQVDSNTASINLLTQLEGDGFSGLAGLVAQVNTNSSSISTLASHVIGEFENTDDWVEDGKDVNKVYYVKNRNLYYYYKEEDQKWYSTDKSYEAGLDGALAGTQQIADDNKASIDSITSWQGETEKSIAAVQQIANQNSADILLVTSWKSDVENDVSSIANIKTTADENKAAISELVKKDSELSTAIAGVKTTADANKASIEQITAWQSNVDPTISSVAGIKQTADDNAAKIEGLTSWQGDTNIAMARIEQKADANGAYIQSTVSNMDMYSVGPHSQASGFTLEQATNILEVGMIYVPTGTVTEEYQYTSNPVKTFVWSENGKDTTKVYYTAFNKRYYYYENSTWNFSSEMPVYTRTFTQGYLYSWTERNGQYRWVTIDKNYVETNETNTSAKAVYFTTTEPSVSGNFGYWYTNGNTVANPYKPYTLYKWESYVDENKVTQYQWVAVATLAGNSQNRAVSQIRQDSNSIELSVTDMKGDVASSKQWIDDNSANIQDVVTWKNDNAESIATTIQSASDSSAYIAQIASVTNDDGTINAAASIVTAVNGADSSVVIDADHIEFKGQKLNIKVDATNIEGTLVIGQLPTTVAEKSDIKTKTSELTNDSGFQNETGVVTIAKGAITADYIKTLNLEVGNQIQMGTNATISWSNVTEKDGVATTTDVNNAKTDAISSAVSEVNAKGYQTSDQVTTISRHEISTAKIRADQVDVTDLKAIGATIGGFTIDDTSIYHTKTSYDDKDNDGVYLGTNGIGLGKGKFYVTYEGFLHAESGEFSGTINGGSINISNNFIVDSDGNVSLNGSIVWGTGSSPTQVVYGRSNYTKPANNTSWSSFPSTSTTGWHRTYSSTYDYCASYTYDGGISWSDAILIRGTDGNNGATPYVGDNGNWYVDDTDLGIRAKGQDGKDGEDGLTPYIEDGWWCLDGVNLGVKAEGTDAEVTPENVYTVLTQGGSKFGCFTTNSTGGDLYINATYINANTLSAITANLGTVTAGSIQSSGSGYKMSLDLDNGVIRCENSGNKFELDADGLAFSGSVFIPGASFKENSNISFSKSTTFGYGVTMNSSIEMNGGVVIRFNNINYNITRDSNGFLKAITAAS